MVSIVILAGGKSSRLGKNKALTTFQGQPLILHVVERVRHLADEIVLVSNPPESLKFLGLPVVKDVIAEVGALGGLLTALEAAHGDLVAVLACDMPFASPALLQAGFDVLKEGDADVVIPAGAGGLEPLHAVYRRQVCLPFVRAAVLNGEKRLISWLGYVNVKVIPPDEVKTLDPAGLAFVNINTPEEFDSAMHLAEKFDR